MAATVTPGLSEIPDLPGLDAGLIYPEHDTACAPRRPDFRLYGTATTAASASALLDDLRQHLTSG